MSQTPYTETEALLCIMQGDDEAAERLVRSMLAGERRSLWSAVRRLDHMVTYVRRELDSPPEPPRIDDPALWTS